MISQAAVKLLALPIAQRRWVWTFVQTAPEILCRLNPESARAGLGRANEALLFL